MNHRLLSLFAVASTTIVALGAAVANDAFALRRSVDALDASAPIASDLQLTTIEQEARTFYDLAKQLNDKQRHGQALESPEVTTPSPQPGPRSLVARPDDKPEGGIEFKRDDRDAKVARYGNNTYRLNDQTLTVTTKDGQAWHINRSSRFKTSPFQYFRIGPDVFLAAKGDRLEGTASIDELAGYAVTDDKQTLSAAEKRAFFKESIGEYEGPPPPDTSPFTRPPAR